MLRSKVLVRALLALIAVAVIAMPVSGAHLHLCFDGAEAPAAIHLSEDGAHHADSGMSGTHEDADLELGAPAIAKKADGAFNLPGLMAVAFIVFRLPLPATIIVAPERSSASVAVSVYRILPPLRAPPV